MEIRTLSVCSNVMESGWFSPIAIIPILGPYVTGLSSFELVNQSWLPNMIRPQHKNGFQYRNKAALYLDKRS